MKQAMDSLDTSRKDLHELTTDMQEVIIETADERIEDEEVQTIPNDETGTFM